jgi:UDP-2,3-diacylglucosamine pyrophosphatase LpxH
VNRTVILVVGDLHMGAGPGDPFRHDRAFAAFLAAMAERRPGAGHPPRLVVLGDLFDLPAAGGGRPPCDEADALARIDRIAAAHERVVAALAAYAAAGGAIDVVAGNHDADLVRPAVQQRVRGMLGGAEVPVAFHPWILHVPGVLYAEHGHQHHDINAFATPLAPWQSQRSDGLALSPAAVAHGLRAAALLAGAGASPRARARRAAYRAETLRDAAPELGLSHAALCAIDAATPRGAAALGARIARRATAAGRHPAAAQRRAAERIHRILEAEGRDVPCYAFGHTHVAERRALGAGPAAAVHVNAGTWSSLRRGGRPERLAYVEIVAGAGAAVARLVDWAPPGRVLTESGRRRPQPDRDRSETAPAPR